MQLTFLAVYFFTVFHKLNTAFLDPTISCAGTLLRQTASANGLSYEPGLIVVRAAAIGTVLAESIILVFLAVPRLRRWGLLFGVILHVILASASFWDFSTMVFALYILFIPSQVFAKLTPQTRTAQKVGLAAFALHLVLSMTVNIAGTASGPYNIRWHLLILLVWYAAFVPMLIHLLRACFAERDIWPGWRLRPLVLLLVPLTAFLNDAAPYLGIKTISTFSMFSNLHTEQGDTNHLIPGLAGLQVAPYERDTVTISSVNLRASPESSPSLPNWAREHPPITIPMLELRRIVAIWRDQGLSSARIEYRHNSASHVTEDALTDPELGAPISWWQRKLLAFRALTSADGANVCRW